MLWQRYKQEPQAWESKVRNPTRPCWFVVFIGLPHTDPPLTSSQERRRHRNRKEIPLPPNRRLITRKSRRHLSQHRFRLQRHGTGFPSTRHQGSKDCSGVLEGVWRVSAGQGACFGCCGDFPEVDSVRVSLLR
jgi:hypothetical protein